MAVSCRARPRSARAQLLIPTPDSIEMHIEPIARAVEAFASLPGIGPKTAQRLTFHLLRQPSEASSALAEAIVRMKEAVHFCSVCGNVDRRRAVQHLPLRSARPRDHLRRRRPARGRDPRAHTRLQGRVPRAPRRTGPVARHRRRRPQDRRPHSPRPGRLGCGSHSGHQPERGRRHHRRLLRTPVAPSVSESRASREGCQWVATSSLPTT